MEAATATDSPPAVSPAELTEEQLAIAESRDGSLAIVAAHADPQVYADVGEQVRPAVPVVVFCPDPDILAQALLGGGVAVYAI